MSSTKTEIDPDESPRRSDVLTRSCHFRLVDAVFLALPILVLAFYIHAFIFSWAMGFPRVIAHYPGGVSRSRIVVRLLVVFCRDLSGSHPLVFDGPVDPHKDNARAVDQI